jgi:hypothetical protein
MTSKDRYVVIENIPGYLPMDDEPATFSNRKDAGKYASELAFLALESYHEIDRPVRKSGSPESGYYIVDPTDPYDLGISISIHPIS